MLVLFEGGSVVLEEQHIVYWLRRLRGFHAADQRPSKLAIQMIEKLSESGDLRGRDVFVGWLSDARDAWRIAGLEGLVSGYVLRGEHAIIEQIRQMLRMDPVSEVRAVAALLLSTQGHWPEKSLFQALEKEHDRRVAMAIARAILSLSGMSQWMVQQEMNILEHAYTFPKAQQLREIVQKVQRTHGQERRG
ncbi:MAG: hypothetical protein AAGJ35_16275 [Myxococcota bacterium]